MLFGEGIRHILDHFAALHHKRNILERVHVREWIAFHGNDVREFPRLESPHSVRPADRGVHSRGLNKGEITTQYAKNGLERIGLLKMDVLGLATLTVAV